MTGKSHYIGDAGRSCQGRTSSIPDDHTITGTRTAIKTKWFLGERKVKSNLTCTLDPASHEAHFRGSAVESSRGLPPPTLTLETRTQSGSRVTSSRTNKAIGGGGRLEFRKFRDAVDQTTRDAGWSFVYEVP